MAQQTLQTVITLSGRVDNTFGAIGSALTNLGSQINGISQRIIGFGKESVKTYTEYDDALREIRAVGGYTSAEMEKLDRLNRDIAKNTTYTNIQSANAMALIAQAGKTVEEQYELLPSVLDLAMAGNLDLANAVDYLMSSLSAMGYGMDYARTLTDQMAKTASVGMTDIDTLGDSLMRLGSASGEFFSSSEEILTILSAMSQFGHDQRGAQAGTWLRNFMLSLAAPTGNIDDIVDAMEQLGLAEEEIQEYASNKSNGIAAEAVNSLIGQGLRVYDENGKLLPAIEIIKSLRDTVRGNATYAEDLTEISGAIAAAGGDIDGFLKETGGLSDNALYNVFAKIFGKRGITTAMNLISISDEEWEKTMSEVVNAEGFAAQMSDIMQGGLGGALRELQAAYTELKTTIGESLAPMVEGAADWLKDIVTSLSEMDQTSLDALVKGAGVIAGAGPGLLLAGGAFRLIGSLLTPGGLIATGVVAITALAAAAKDFADADMAGKFGEMELDPALSEYVEGLGDDFRDAYSQIDAFNSALRQSVTDYTTASQTFSGSLLSSMLTGTTLTDEEKKALQSLGQDMYASLVEGIHNSTAASLSYFNMLFGGEGTAEYDPVYQEIIGLTNQSYQDALTTAENLSQGLRDALTSAFDDGVISPEEYAEIRSFMQSYNEAMSRAAAEAQREQDYIDQQLLLHKAQTASYDEIKALAGETQGKRDSLLKSAEEEYLRQRYGLEYRYNQAIENGTMIDGAYVTETDRDNALAALQTQYKQHVAEQSARYDDILIRLWQSSIEQSDLGAAYGELGALADAVINGELRPESAVSAFKKQYGNNSLAGEADWGGNNTRTQLGEYLARMIASYGGYEGIISNAAYYEKTGDSEKAAFFRKLYAMQQINDNFAETGVLNYNGFWASLFGDSAVYSSSADEYALLQAKKDEFLAYLSGFVPNKIEQYYEELQENTDSFSADAAVDTARRAVDAFGGDFGGLDKFMSEIGGGSGQSAMFAWSALSKEEQAEFNRLKESLRGIYDFERVLEDESSVFAEEGNSFRDAAAVYSLLYGNAGNALGKYRIGADEDDGYTLPIDVTDNGSAAETRSIIEATFSDPVDQVVRIAAKGAAGMYSMPSLRQYADGGRADTASIFGEAGPEWAIPEAHTERTASLLDAAREASGFTWPELLSRNGGLNADGGHRPAQLIYSPTIIAGDATGVEQKLIEDKARLDAWYREKRLRDEVMAYV